MANPPASPPSEDEEYNKLKSFFYDAVVNPESDHICAIKNPYEDSDEEDNRIMADPAVAAAEPDHRQPFRTMFVTIGSIASFKSLIEEVLSDKFLETLAGMKYNRLIIQCGPDLELFERIRPQKGFASHWIDIVGFAYTDKIKTYYEKCTPSAGGWGGERRGRGIIMAHAGAGTILEALDVDARVIVIPNTSLMDNHQLELAEELDKQGYLLQGHLGKLHEDVERMDNFEPENWPPKPPKESKYRHLVDIIMDLFPSKHILEASEDEVREMRLEDQMWRDMLSGQPFPDGDPRHEFLNGHTSEKKEKMYHEWRNNWYANRKIADQLDLELDREQKGTVEKTAEAGRN
ncbi:putative UDP-N-acetylglucosamine transferase subunit ALG13 [Seiridium cardinale]